MSLKETIKQFPQSQVKDLRNKLSCMSKAITETLTNPHFAPKRYAFIQFQFKIEMTDLAGPRMKETKILLALAKTRTVR